MQSDFQVWIVRRKETALRHRCYQPPQEARTRKTQAEAWESPPVSLIDAADTLSAIMKTLANPGTVPRARVALSIYGSILRLFNFVQLCQQTINTSIFRLAD